MPAFFVDAVDAVDVVDVVDVVDAVDAVDLFGVILFCKPWGNDCILGGSDGSGCSARRCQF